jgi:hypothetical protein
MRLSIRIEDDVYSVALAIARSEHISIGKAINLLARRGFHPSTAKPASKKSRTTDFPVSAGKMLITSEDVDRADTVDQT